MGRGDSVMKGRIASLSPLRGSRFTICPSGWTGAKLDSDYSWTVVGLRIFCFSFALRERVCSRGLDVSFVDPVFDVWL